MSVAALGERYLKACRRPGDKEYRQASGQQIMRHAIRVLTEFALHGSFTVRGKFAMRAALPTALESTLADYRQFSDEYLRHRQSTLALRVRDIRRFFLYLASRGIQSVAGVDGGVLSGFVAFRARSRSARSPGRPTEA